MPNVDNINKVINEVMRKDMPFDMMKWTTCVHGCTLRAMGHGKRAALTDTCGADKFLDVSMDTYFTLIEPMVGTREEACLVLRTLADTGLVDWPAARRLRELIVQQKETHDVESVERV